jgi:hypothetical protein
MPFAHNDPLVQRSARAKTDVGYQCESTDHTCSKCTAVQVVGLDSASDSGTYQNGDHMFADSRTGQLKGYLKGKQERKKIDTCCSHRCARDSLALAIAFALRRRNRIRVLRCGPRGQRRNAIQRWRRHQMLPIALEMVSLV